MSYVEDLEGFTNEACDLLIVKVLVKGLVLHLAPMIDWIYYQ